jgi:prepilin-type N-terminal cleavage/methylation domain-containing protein
MKSKNLGFTLVELLIVIALIAILSVAVIATINPVEQANKARDAQYKNDAAEILNAYDRYYVSTGMYPWNVGPGITIAAGVSTMKYSHDSLFGVKSAGSTQAALISSGELKSTFLNKTPFTNTVAGMDEMFTGYDSVTNTISVCFIPKASVNRQSSSLKCLTPFGGDSGGLAAVGGNAFIPYLGNTPCLQASKSSWDTPNYAINIANLMCVSN